MKCRDMNPGNGRGHDDGRANALPSMKCRDMNPGNITRKRLADVTQEPSMKCRDMNPGNAYISWICLTLLIPQ